jgi:hypothetical protein
VDLNSLQIAADTLEGVKQDANKGIITAEQYYMTLLLTLPVNPVDYAGALNAIHEAEYNISLYADVEASLRTLKEVHGVRLAIVTDSMATSIEKKSWMQRAGLDIEMYASQSLDHGITLTPFDSVLTPLTSHHFMFLGIFKIRCHRQFERRGRHKAVSFDVPNCLRKVECFGLSGRILGPPQVRTHWGQEHGMLHSGYVP